ncbi:MAG: efflux family protein [Deltaproteobacteria bacterium]|jgi:putative MATE family efflux protein|nr:efflux family protein [Deltaproteobacteria bacterium]
MPQRSPLTTEPIPELVRRIAVPASIGYFFNTMYNVVDTYFAGLVSTQALASLSLSLPVFFIIIAAGTGVSTGTTALIANALGAGNREEARLYAVQGISFGILTALALTVFGLLISPFLFGVLGAKGEYLSMVLDYMNTLFLGTVLFLVLYMFNAVLNGQGETKPFRNVLIAGFFLNIGLDPWFIYGGLGVPAMGVVGIALATLVAEAVGCVYLGYKVVHTGLVSRKDLANALPRLEPFKEIARQGLPASVNLLTVGMGIFVITYFVSLFGKEAVAAYGSAMRVEQIVLVPSIGLNVATLTLVAQNNGAQLFDRIKQTLRISLFYGAVLMGIGTVLVLAGAKVLMTFFTDDPSVIRIGATYLRIDALVFYAYVVLFVHVAALQGMKRPMYALWIGLYRQIVAPAILFWSLIHVFETGLTGIWWGIFSVTWSAALFTLFYARRRIGRESRPT